MNLVQKLFLGIDVVVQRGFGGAISSAMSFIAVPW